MNHYRALCVALLLALFASPAMAAKLYVSEYADIAETVHGNTFGLAQIASEPSLDQAPVDYSGGAATSAAVGANTKYVRLICDTQCSVKFGTSPTATTSSKLLSALTAEYFGVPAGQAYKISVISNP